jgi:hypothetical protein
MQPRQNFIIVVLLLLFAPACLASLDYAAWAQKNQDGSWTRAAESAVSNSALIRLNPSDITQFCPNYPKLAKPDRRKFWVGLLSAMSKPESNFKPEAAYRERFKDAKGKPVVSRGLLQISIESANQKRYDCDIRHPALLHDPVVNLACGVRILAKWVGTDGVIASRSPQLHQGGGRYWSTLRAQNGKVSAIADFTRGLPFCGTTPRKRPNGIRLRSGALATAPK